MRSTHTDEADAASLDTVREKRAQLASVLNRLGDIEEMDAPSLMLAFSGDQMNKTAEGYVMLREARRVDCSKLLIRPIVELTIRMLAIQNQPGLIYRLAFTEVDNYKKLIRAAAAYSNTEPPLAMTLKGLGQFKQNCEKGIPGADLQDKPIRLIDVAKLAGPKVMDLYEGHYRLYCNFTHSTLEAITGRWDEFTDQHDNQTVELGISQAAEVLENIAGRRNSMPN